MSSIEYSLYRIKMVRPYQASLLQDNSPPRELLLNAIDARPSSESRNGFRWHIGNIDKFDQSCGYFAVGRTSLSTVGKFDQQTSNFIEEEQEQSPYTHCVFDADVGIVCIAKKPSLSRVTKGIAEKLRQLLLQAEVIVNNGVDVQILPIPDPESFIEAINKAFKVSRFSATFRGPNPFDADKHFQKPQADFLNAAAGTKGKTTISGADLNKSVLQKVARSTAATGNEASARIQKSEDEKPTTVNLRDNPIKKKYDEKDHKPQTILEDFKIQYRQVRDDGND